MSSKTLRVPPTLDASANFVSLGAPNWHYDCSEERHSRKLLSERFQIISPTHPEENAWAFRYDWHEEFVGACVRFTVEVACL